MKHSNVPDLEDLVEGKVEKEAVLEGLAVEEQHVSIPLKKY